MSKGACEILKNFLNTHPDLPIVTHNVKYDRDKVLRPAFEKLEAVHLLPPEKRWRCTYELSERCQGLLVRTLDSVLEHFGFEPRDEEEKHDAIRDCELTAKIYMELMKLPEPKRAELGFTKE